MTFLSNKNTVRAPAQDVEQLISASVSQNKKFVIFAEKKIKMLNPEYFSETNKLIAERKFGDALNLLKTYVKNNGNTAEIEALIAQIQLSADFENRDIYGNTNLDMDPWFS